MSITIYDVAELSGVSPSTVSRILSGKITSHGKSYMKVMEAVKTLGYQPKDTSPLYNIERREIMVITDDIVNPFYMEIASGVNQVISGARYRISIYLSDTQMNSEENLLRFAETHHFAGVILITVVETPELVQLLKNYTIPIVLVNRTIRSLDVNSICIDNERGGYMATQYLIENGHKKIIHLAGPMNSTASSDRLRGYRGALEDANLPFSKDLVFYGNLKAQSGTDFARLFIRENMIKKCTAIFCANDIMAASIQSELAEHGIRIPDDLSIICFDDTAATTYGGVKLTTVAQSPQNMGRLAGNRLLKMIDKGVFNFQKSIFPPKLIERNSVKNLLSPDTQKSAT